jgi:pyruvate/2-oxoglutarate dehydrogenase complex dihydrolipoamide dehydrogenase (E3) component
MSTWAQEVAHGASGPVGGDPNECGVYPLDEHNATLLDLVAPKEYTNPSPPSPDFEYDVVAVGAGAGGLVSSKQTARRGGKSALIERHLAGGDCLNVGCVPSKALLRCARAIREARGDLAEFGMVRKGPVPEVDFAAIMERLRRLRARIAPHDSFKGAANLGVDVYQGDAKFTGPNTVEVRGQTIRFKKAVVATGAAPFVPPIPGLRDTPCLTNSNLYNLTELPKSMLVLGGGPIGSEMAQAFATFGTEVTIVSAQFLEREDADARDIVRAALEKDGVKFEVGCKVTKVSFKDDLFCMTITGSAGDERVLVAEQLLVATGRAPNVNGLGLEAAGVEFDRRGVKINEYMQSSNPKVYAVGDVASKYQFTHMAGTMASMVVDNIVFNEQRSVENLTIPWCTYTEPEVAHVGKYEGEVEGGCDTYKASLEHNDRAILEGCDEGFFKIHCEKGTDKIVGATVVGANAGEMLAELTLCVQFGIPLGRSGLGSVIHAYPTVADGVGGCAFSYKMKHWKRIVDGKVVGGERTPTLPQAASSFLPWAIAGLASAAALALLAVRPR